MPNIVDFTKHQGTTRRAGGKRSSSNGAARRVKTLEKQVADLQRDCRALKKEIAGRQLADDQFGALDAFRIGFTRIFNELDRAGRLPLALRLEIEELFVQLGWGLPW